jgi:hypothetical protein
MWTTIAHSAVFRGAVSGLLAAAVVDFHAFATWKSFDEAKQYNWGTALFRWCQGLGTGALTGLGFGAVLP